MKKLFTLCLLIVSLSASAQWQQTGSKVRYVNGLGIPTKDTAAGVAADSSQILIRPADSSLYVKYKRTWMRVGGGGGSIAGSGTTNYIPKFTSASAIGNSQIFDNGTSVGIGTTPSAWRSGARAIQFGANGFGALWEQGSGAVDLSFASYESATNTFLYKTTGDLPTLYQQVTGNHAWYNALSGTAGNPITWSERMRITSGGDVGIGTTSPATDLHISRAGSSTFRLSNTSNSTNVELGISTALGFVGTQSNNSFGLFTNNTERMRITSGGDVGIGTTSPDARLRVVGTYNGTQAIFGFTDGRGLQISTGFNGTNEAVSFLNARGVGAGMLQFQTDGTDRMRIGNGGNVMINTTTDNGTDRLQVSGSASVTSSLGIGTSPSVGALHIKTTTPRIVIDDNDNSGTASIWFRPQSASFAIRGSIELVSTGSAAPTRFVIASTDTMTFRTNNIERMRITSAGGNVLISTTTDNNTDKLQVNGSIQGTGFNQAYTAKTGTYTATTSDYFIDCTSGTFTVNLFTAVGNTGRILIIKNSGAGTITVDPNGAQTIDGAATQSLSTQWSRVHIISDGANWKIISN